MDDVELKRGFRNGWILVLLLLLIIAVWTTFTFWVHRDEIAPRFVPGGRDFVPGESPYGLGYRKPQVEPQGK